MTGRKRAVDGLGPTRPLLLTSNLGGAFGASACGGGHQFVDVTVDYSSNWMEVWSPRSVTCSGPLIRRRE